MKFADDACRILNMIKDAGYSAYFVGGAVRDMLLKRKTEDYDITTSATPDEICFIFKDYRLLCYGIKHGTVAVLYHGLKIEITTLRTEEGYADKRRPDKVRFIGSLQEDLARRDFTINAMAYDDVLYDYYGGINDLNNKLIRAVGDPVERFSEDALRMLRAIRFSVKLSFKIDFPTKDAIHSCCCLLKHIAIERIMDELGVIISYDYLYLINDFFDVLKVIFPHLHDVKKEELLKAAEGLPNDDALIYTAVFSFVKEDLQDAIKPYHFSLDTQNIILTLLGVKLDLACDLINSKKILKNYPFGVMIKYALYHYRQNRELLDCLNKAQQMCHDLKSLKISGRDLIALGLSEGKDIKIVLDELLDLVIEEKLANEKDALLREALRLKEKLSR